MIEPFQIYAALAAIAAIAGVIVAAGPIEILELELATVGGAL